MISKIVILLASAQAVQLQREPLLTWAPSNKKSHPVDYFVPNFGLDEEILSTQGSYKNEESRQNVNWEASLKKDQPDAHPTNYFVPNFGLDSDVLNTKADIELAETKLNHKWTASLKKDQPDAHPVDYVVPNFGPDQTEGGVADVAESIMVAERQLNHNWVATVKGPKPPPTDYAVPNFGLDETIQTSLSNLKTAEGKYGQWDLPKDD